MKKVFTPIMVFASFFTCANASAEALIVNDFNDGTPQGWHKGGAADTPVTAVAGEGDGTGAQPIPVGNGYLKFISVGPDGEGPDKNITVMAGREWRGNYIAMGAKSITARIKVVDAPHDLEMHVAFGNTLADLRTRYASAGVMVPNDGQWHDVAFSLTEGLHQISIGGHGKSSAAFSLEETLANINAVRLTQGKLGEVYFDRRGPFEGYNAPEKIKAELWIDDITLSTDEVGASTPTPTPAAKNVLCIDANRNGACDPGESSQQDFALGEPLPAAFQSATYPTLLSLANGTVLTAAPGSTDISAYSTLLNNELLFNPTINGDVEQARQYLNNKLVIGGTLNAEQEAQIATSIHAAQSGGHSYKGIAAAVDAMVAKGGFDVSVADSAIQSQRFVRRKIMTMDHELNWDASSGDESVVEMLVLPGRNLAVVATREHNSLLVVDISNAHSPQLKSQIPFAAVDGSSGDYATTDTEVTEHPITAIKAAPDGQSVYVLVAPKDGAEGVNGDKDDRYGVFKVAIDADGKASAHNAAGSKRFANANIGFIDVSHAGVYAYDKELKSVHLLDADLAMTGMANPGDVKVATVNADLHGEYLYFGSKGDEEAEPPVPHQLHRYNLASQQIDATVSLGGEPRAVYIYDHGKKGLTYSHRQASAEIIDLKAMSVAQTLPLDEDLGQQVRGGVVTADGHYALLSGWRAEQIWVFDLTLPEMRLEKIIPREHRIAQLLDDGHGNILNSQASGHGGGAGGSMGMMMMSEGKVMTPAELVAEDKKALKPEPLNSDRPLSAVFSDLTLPDSIPGGGGSVIDWQTTAASVDMTETAEKKRGAVSRPTGSDEVATLTASFSYSFRDIVVTDQTVFDLTVRQKPEALVSTGELVVPAVMEMDVSPDGSRAVLLSRGVGHFTKKKQGSLFVVKRDANDAPVHALPTSTDDDGELIGQALPAPYTGEETMGVHFIDDQHVVVAIPKGEDADGKKVNGALLVYMVSDGPIAGGTAPMMGAPVVMDGTVHVMSRKNNGKLAVVVGQDQMLEAKIVDVSNPMMLSVIDSIPLRPTKVKDVKNIELSDDAQSVFLVENDILHKYSGATGKPVISVEKKGFRPHRMHLTGGVINLGTRDGRLYRFNPADLSELGESFYSYGYVAAIDVVANKTFMSTYKFGVTVIDHAQPKELQFFDWDGKKNWRGGVSDDGRWYFSAKAFRFSEEPKLSVFRVPE